MGVSKKGRLKVGFDMDFSVNRSRLKAVVSRKVISFSDISAGNFIVGWKLLASLIKSSTSFLLQSQREKTSSNEYKASILLAWCYFVGLGLFQSLLVLAKKSRCSHARECSHRPFVTPHVHLHARGILIKSRGGSALSPTYIPLLIKTVPLSYTCSTDKWSAYQV